MAKGLIDGLNLLRLLPIISIAKPLPILRELQRELKRKGRALGFFALMVLVVSGVVAGGHGAGDRHQHAPNLLHSAGTY